MGLRWKSWNRKMLYTSQEVWVGWGGGDCDSDKDCRAGLKCGNNNCHRDFEFLAHPENDCCYDQNKMEFVMVNLEPQHAVHLTRSVGWVAVIVTLIKIVRPDSNVEITIVTEILNSMPIQRMIAAMIQNKMEFVMVNWEPQHAVHLTRSVGWVAVIVTLIRIVRLDSNVEITI